MAERSNISFETMTDNMTDYVLCETGCKTLELQSDGHFVHEFVENVTRENELTPCAAMAQFTRLSVLDASLSNQTTYLEAALDQARNELLPE